MSIYKVSVIVPIYNASRNLRQCIDSILAQTFRDFELICVDDGSTDDSLSILREYEAADSRVRVLTQTNQHAGVARNAGKAVAQGEYLVFWDSDDFFHPKALELMYHKCEEDSADICICSANHYFEDLQKALPSSGYICGKYVPSKRPFSAMDVPDYILNITTAHPWNKMFRREYIESIQLDFQATKNGNDIFFVINAIARAKRITLVNKPLINYRINQSDSLFSNLTESPLVPINNWIATRESLIAHGAFPKRSFDNKILNTLVYFLHNINNWHAFCETVTFLQGEGLSKLGLSEQDEDYYFSDSNAECLHHLLTDSTEDFLAFFANLTYRQLSAKNGSNQDLTKKVKRLRQAKKQNELLIASLEQKIKQQNDVIKAQSEKISAQSGEISEQSEKISAQVHTCNDLTRELEHKEKEISALKLSTSYRLGCILTAIPRKIKHLLKGN